MTFGVLNPKKISHQ